MNLHTVLPVIGSLVLVGVGLVGLVRPRPFAAALGVGAHSPMGVAELRALLGGSYLALGVICLALRDPAAYLTAGVVFLGLVVGKLVGLLADRAPLRAAVPLILGDLAVGLLLLAGYLPA